MKRYTILLFLLIGSFVTVHSQTKILMWGVPEETCKEYGGKYDEDSGLSEWSPRLVLKDSLPNKVSGVLVFNNKQVLFNAASVKGKDGLPIVANFMLTSSDNKFSILASLKSADELEIKMGKVVYSIFGSKEPKLIKGDESTIKKLMAEESCMRLLPLLSYKLGVEKGLTGNNYAAAFIIHRLALAISKEHLISMFRIEKNRLIPLAKSAKSRSQNDCAGRAVGTVQEECLGRCGPVCECWEWACGDCCCHVGCRDHDLGCECSEVRCYLTAIFAPMNCAPCNNPGNLPECNKCQSGKVYCSYTRQCIPAGAKCQPTCRIGEIYCERLKRCVKKGQCTPPAASRCTSCPPTKICFQGQCLDREDVM